jgi:hypothetical protein
LFYFHINWTLCIAFEFRQVTPYSFTPLRFSVRSMHLAIPAISAETLGVYFGSCFSSLQVKHNGTLIPCTDICTSLCHPLCAIVPAQTLMVITRTSHNAFRSFSALFVFTFTIACSCILLWVACKMCHHQISALSRIFGNVIKELCPTPLLDYKNNIFFSNPYPANVENMVSS